MYPTLDGLSDAYKAAELQASQPVELPKDQLVHYLELAFGESKEKNS